MKFLFFTFLAIAILDNTTVWGQNSSKAVEHMASISNQMGLLMKDTWAYTSSVAHSKSARKIDSRRKELIKTSQFIQRNIAKIPPYQGDASLRDSTLAFLKIHYLILSENYAKIVDLEAIAEESYDLMEAYLAAQEQANNKLDEAGDRMELAQETFAAKNNITLVDGENKTAKKLGKASSVMSYYNKFYLIFFKSYKQELYMFDALQKGDIGAFEQNRNALVSVSEEGLKKLDTMKTFNTDVSVMLACKKAITFYRDEALNRTASLTDFPLKKETFDKVKKAFDSKPQSSRTQEDIDLYNKAVNEMNAAVTSYNKLNTALDKERSEMLNNWNKTAQEFMARHTPKGR